jgi:hypothetical protein
MVKGISKSGIKTLDCPECIKIRMSNTRGKFYGQLYKIHKQYLLVLNCSTCKKIQIFNVIRPEILPIFKGMLFCCRRNSIFKITTTNKSVICKCLVCDKKIVFERMN